MGRYNLARGAGAAIAENMQAVRSLVARFPKKDRRTGEVGRLGGWAVPSGGGSYMAGRRIESPRNPELSYFYRYIAGDSAPRGMNTAYEGRASANVRGHTSGGGVQAVTRDNSPFLTGPSSRDPLKGVESLSAAGIPPIRNVLPSPVGRGQQIPLLSSVLPPVGAPSPFPVGAPQGLAPSLFAPGKSSLEPQAVKPFSATQIPLPFLTGKPSPPPVGKAAQMPPPFPVASTGKTAAYQGLSNLGMFGFAAGGAAAGGVISYGTGGDFTQGAFAGLAIGTGAYHLGGATKAIGKYATKKGWGGEGFTSGMIKATEGLESAEGRKLAFAAGAGLGGFMFGGNRSHKRGFNANRGNSIGR